MLTFIDGLPLRPGPLSRGSTVYNILYDLFLVKDWNSAFWKRTDKNIYDFSRCLESSWPESNIDFTLNLGMFETS